MELKAGPGDSSCTSSPPAMNALVLHAVGDARFEQIPRPKPATGEALVRVAFCGICGSDLPRTFVKGTYRFPTVCGHEFAGVVESCGEGVTQVAPGDRVVVFPLLWCGKCAACERGNFVQCSNYDYFGSRRDGALAEYVAAPVRNLVRVPEGVSLEAASMTEPAAVALHALKRAGGGFIGQSVVIFGAGPIGLMAAQLARVMGAAQVILFDLVARKLAMAVRLGFPLAFNPRETDPLEKVQELTCARCGGERGSGGRTGHHASGDRGHTRGRPRGAAGQSFRRREPAASAHLAGHAPRAGHPRHLEFVLQPRRQQ